MERPTAETIEKEKERKRKELEGKTASWLASRETTGFVLPDS